MRDFVIKKLMDEKLIVIARDMENEKIIPLAKALFKGGIRILEITFTLKAPESFKSTGKTIKSVIDHFGDDILMGAGTVVTPELVDIAADAGALYIVSPNTDINVIKRTKDRGLVSIPGALTPSECMTAFNAGADFIKLFPIGELGPGYLKAVKAPLSHLKFVCTGGVNDKNIPDFIKAGAVGFGVGGNLVNKEWIDASQFDKITELAKRYVEAVNS